MIIHADDSAETQKRPVSPPLGQPTCCCGRNRPTNANRKNSMTAKTTTFNLPDRLARKGDAVLIAHDEQHFAAIAEALDQSITELSGRLDRLRRTAGGAGQEAMDRDIAIHQLTARLRGLRRFGPDACIGRLISEGDPEPVYIGRFGLTDNAGRRLLLDWRSPAAEPFFGATHATPMGMASRRRYRWTHGRIVDYWDEVFTSAGFEQTVTLDDQSAFIASLEGSRSTRMRDVLGTIQADQDAIVRAGSRGALVVDGGPGTGKTVVALHRTAYLLYSDPRLDRRRGGVLFVGPSAGYLSYIDDVLPSLGEEGVQIATLSDLVVEGTTAGVEDDPRVALLKASGDLVKAVETAVRMHERPPTVGMVVETPWADLWLDATDWAEAFAAPAGGTPHNAARDDIWDVLITILLDRLDSDEDVSGALLRRYLVQDNELTNTLNRAWPLLDPVGIVADLWSVPSYLEACAPWLSSRDLHALQRGDARAWTVSDLPIIDAARQRIGDPEEPRRHRRREAALAAERENMNRVVDDLIAADDSELLVMSMLRGQDAQNSLVDESALPTVNPDTLAGPFAHIIVDEAQELTDAEWQMLIRRCPSRSFTIVGDRAQARHGFSETWSERLDRIGLTHIALASLSINYRTPEEIMVEAEPIIRAILPDANVPVSVRKSGLPVVHASRSQLSRIVETWLTEHDDGTACVISANGVAPVEQTTRVRILSPLQSKGLEFDLVVLLDPGAYGTGVEGAVDRYVAMTRATQQLIVLTNPSN